MSRWNLCWLLGFIGVGLVSLSLAYTAPTREAKLQQKHENLKLVVDVLEEVQGKYVKELSPDKVRELVENMVNGGLERLDQHSSFINAEEYKQFMKQSKGRFGGIGIRIGMDRVGRVIVESPMVGTPAYEAGVLAGDIIMKVDGFSTENLSMKQVVEKIQGEPGTKVKLSVLHEGAKKLSDGVDLEITRAEINIDSVLGDRRNPVNLKEWDFWVDPALKIAYIRLVAFTETTTAELTKVVEALQKLGMRGLVLDLRGNPGGLLRSAVEVSSMFLPEGKRVVTTKNRNGREEVYNSRAVEGHTPANYPIAILINRYSASASEIVAAALQDHFRAIIVGERSYGKGSVQNIIPMEGGASALKLTTASYWRPSGRNIHRFPESKEEEEWGVRPDKGYEVKLTDEERLEYARERRDRDVVRRQDAEGQKENGDKKKAESFKDRVLDKAVEYIKGELNKAAAPAAAPGAIPGGASNANPALLPQDNRNTQVPEAALDAAWDNSRAGYCPHRA
jgi:carboxyl-terminal processing protease